MRINTDEDVGKVTQFTVTLHVFNVNMLLKQNNILLISD